MDRNDHTQPNSELNNPSPIAAGSPPQAPGPLEDNHTGADVGPPEPKTLGEWFRVNGSTLLFGILGLVLLYFVNDRYVKIGLDTALKVAVGLGFIIFIHELGHFLVAKLCDVHVTTFSIGFGPALPFCSYTWGETTYKLAVFPLGGFVQMVGQVDGDESSDGSEDDPRSYKNKSVWQRMAIISAGVVMNAIFACVAFTLVFLGPGKVRIAPVVAIVDSGKPAFREGLRTGSTILSVNGLERPYFETLKYETLASLGRIEITTQRQGLDKNSKTYDITPHQGAYRSIGILNAMQAKLISEKFANGELKAPVVPYGAAANCAFEFDDVIVGITDPDNPAKMRLLSPDPRNPGSGLKDFFELQRCLTRLAGKEINILVERGPVGHTKTVEIPVPPAWHRTVNARMKMGPIAILRKNSDAEKMGVRVPRPIHADANEPDSKAQMLDGDLIEKVEVMMPDNKLMAYGRRKDKENEPAEKSVEPLDPIRLPFQLKEWAARWRKDKPGAEKPKVKLFLKRESDTIGGRVFEAEPVVVELNWDDDWQFDRVLPLDANSPQPIPELGLAYVVKTQVDGLEHPDPSAELQSADEIINYCFVSRKTDGTIVEGSWRSKPLKGTEWARLFQMIQDPAVTALKVKVNRGDKELEIELVPQADQTWPSEDRGIVFTPDTRLEKASNVVEAVEMGFRDTHHSMMQVYLHLRGLVAGTISVDGLAGPVTITTMAYQIAQADFWEFVFFLGLISVNLAVINFLPVPVLDGGHMVFLLYEKLRGKPASEGVRSGATIAGLFMLGCLMIFVMYLDIKRLVGGGH